MFVQTLAERKIICSEKMVLKLGLVLIALAVFSNQNMPINAYETGEILKGYIQKNTMYEEQQKNALFLWEKELNQKYKNNKIEKIEDGIIFVSLTKYINSRPIKINVAEVNRKINKDIEIIPQVNSNNLHSRTKIKKIADMNNAILAINGTYFKQNTGTPLGALVINNKIISGPIYERVGLGISENKFKTSRISFNGILKTKNEEIKINNINQARMQFSEILLYNENWGIKSENTKKDSCHIAIKNNEIIAKSDYPLYIPNDGYVISGPKESLQNINLGEKISLDYNLNPNWNDVEHIISGGPYLIKTGSIFIDTQSQNLNAISGRNPRTAIGYTKDNILILVTINGRKEGSSGVTLNELAKIMKELGCYEAINLDGGSSTVMYVDGNTYSGSNIKNSVAINNALIVKLKA